MVEQQKILEEKELLKLLLNKENTIQEIDTTFDPNKDVFDHIVAIEKDARKYVKSLSTPQLRIALARIAEKNPNILMSLMNNFAENFPGGIYRGKFYDPEKAKLLRTDWHDSHSEYFRSHSTDHMFASIDANMQKHKIDQQTLINIREEIKQSHILTQNDVLKHIHQVFVDLLEEGYSREDLIV